MKEKEIIEEIIRICGLLVDYKNGSKDFEIELQSLKYALQGLRQERERNARARLERKIDRSDKRRKKHYMRGMI